MNNVVYHAADSRVWKLLPQSLGVIVAATVLAVDLAPRRALILGLVVCASFGLLYLLRRYLPHVYLWYLLEPVAMLLNIYWLRWLFVVGCGWYAVATGLSFEITLQVVGEILLADWLLMLLLRQAPE